MADFSAQLPDATTIVPAPVFNPGPNPLDAVLGTISSGLSQFQNDMEERARQKKASDAARKEQREIEAKRYLFEDRMKRQEELVNPFAEALSGPSQLQTPGSPVQGPPPEPLAGESPTTQDEVASAIEERKAELSNVQQAVLQGNMPRAAFEAMVDKSMQEVMAMFPDVDPEELIDFAGKLNTSDQLFRRYKRRMEYYEALDTGVNEKAKEALQVGADLYGAEAANYSEEELIYAGMQELRRRQVFARKKEELDLLEQTGRLDKQQYELQKEINADEVRTTSIQAAFGVLEPLINNAQRVHGLMMENPGANPALEEEYSNVMQLLEQRSNVIIEQIAADAEMMNPGSGDGIREYLQKSMNNMVIQPFKTRDENFLALARRLETNLGIKTDQALPFITLLQEAGFKLDLSQILIESLSEEQKQALKKEIAGVSNINMLDLRSRSTAQQQIADIAAVLNGDATLNSMNLSPEQLNDNFRVIRKTTTDLTAQLRGGNFNNQDEWLNGMSEMAVMAQQLNRSSSANSLENALAMLAGNGTNGVFGKLLSGEAVDREQAQRVLVGTRAGVARAMLALDKQPKNFQYHNVVYNRNEAKWEVQFNRAEWEKANRTRRTNPRIKGDPVNIAREQLATRRPPEPPAAARKMVAALNMGATFLVSTSQFDESAPKGTPMELRRWYTRGELTPSQQKEQKALRESAGGDADKFKALTELKDALAQDYEFEAPNRVGAGGVAIDASGNATTTGSNGQKVTVMSVDNINAQFANNPVKRQVEERAARVGIPTNIALVLAGHEGRFNPKARADAGKGRTAWGPMQVVDKIWDETAMERYGKKVSQLSTQQNVDLGLWILAQNFENAGNWRDALAMYHSGRPYAEATGSDGNIATQNYVDAMLAAAG